MKFVQLIIAKLIYATSRTKENKDHVDDANEIKGFVSVNRNTLLLIES